MDKGIPSERTIVAGGLGLVGLVVLAAVLDGTFVEGYDWLIGLGGDTSRSAALVGWVAGFAFVACAGLAALWPAVLRRVWFRVVAAVAFVPFMSLQPSRAVRSADIEDEYWYLGSFFDTYNPSLVVLVGSLGVMLAGLWMATRRDEISGHGVSGATRSAGVLMLGGTVAYFVFAVAFA